MNNRDEFYWDMNSRANEIISELSRDGYPDTEQLTIVTGMLAILLGTTSETADELKEGVALSQEMIAAGARVWFDLRRRRNGR
jgi:hypothetical protein